MRTILFIIQKEFKQIFRNRAMIPIIFVMPILQLLVLSNAATFDIKNIKLTWVDKDLSSSSRLLFSKFNSSNYFKIVNQTFSTEDANLELSKNLSDAYIEIPQNFEKNLFKENNSKIQLIINAIDGTKAAMAMNYSTNIILDFNSDIRKQNLNSNNLALVANISDINIIQSNWFNPELNYTVFMVPGILVLLVTMIGVFLSGMNIVKEKELGTIEQINVTPIKKYQFVVGKLLPFWILAIFELSFGLIIAKLVFDIPFLGSVGLVFAFASVYMLVILGIGLFISTITETQQQSMFVSWFFMVVFILLSGLFTPIENMPSWIQTITHFNPIKYFIEVIRMVMLKGAGYNEIKSQFIIMGIYAIITNLLAVTMYRKRA